MNASKILIAAALGSAVFACSGRHLKARDVIDEGATHGADFCKQYKNTDLRVSGRLARRTGQSRSRQSIRAETTGLHLGPVTLAKTEGTINERPTTAPTIYLEAENGTGQVVCSFTPVHLQTVQDWTIGQVVSVRGRCSAVKNQDGQVQVFLNACQVSE